MLSCKRWRCHLCQGLLNDNYLLPSDRVALLAEKDDAGLNVL